MPSRSPWPLMLFRVVAVAGAITAGGCDPRVSRDELGTLIFEAKDLPGAGKAYDRPEMRVPGGPSSPEAAPADKAPSDGPNETSG